MIKGIDYMIRPFEEDWIGRVAITFNGENLYEILKDGKVISCVPRRKLKRIKEKLGDRVLDTEQVRQEYDEFCELMSTPIKNETDTNLPKSNFGKQLLSNLK